MQVSPLRAGRHAATRRRRFGGIALGTVIWLLDAALRELMLFAGVGILAGGLDDLAVDLAYLGCLLRHRLSGRGDGILALADLAPPATPGRFAIFVPAWDEAAVIGAMLRTALARLRHPDYAIFVGCYPNDRATIDAVMRVAREDARVRPVIGARDGPTTKADCLNALWRALRREDAGRDAGARARAVVLHDAEDVVHPAELAVFDALIGEHAIVQLPVLPLPQPRSPLVAGHYNDEFAEAHGKQLVVRELVGAGLPLAGVGCAIRLDALADIARARGGDPFDADSLTEDYELGLRIAAGGGRSTLARVREAPGGPVIAIREYFPATLPEAVRQKARWMNGIALAGWDRIGWSHLLHWGDHWMRMRDRRGPLALLVLGAAYLGLLLWGASGVAHALVGTAPAPLDGWPALLLRVNAALLCWRVLVRGWFTARAYGWAEGSLAFPRMLTGNLVSLLAGRRALWRYLAGLRGTPMTWEKTSHRFPAELGGAGPA